MKTQNQLPSLSVVVPAKNRLPTLLKALRRLASGSSTPDEVIIVDDGSDVPLSVGVEAEPWPFPVKILRNQVSKGAPYSRNLGIREAKEEILLLMDDDIWPDREMIFYHKLYHTRYREEGYAIHGRVMFDPMMTYTPLRCFLENRGPHNVMVSPAEGQLCTGLVTANVSMKRRFLDGKRLFDESFPFNRNEDTEFGQRLMLDGFNPRFHNAASATHHSPLELDGWLRTLNQSGQCKAYWAVRDPDGCVFSAHLGEVLGKERKRRLFEERHAAVLKAFGKEFLEADVADLPEEETELFCRFMQEAQPWLVNFGMFDYWKSKVPRFDEIAASYGRAAACEPERFIAEISAYFDLCGDFIPGFFAGLRLCNYKGRHAFAASLDVPDSKWCRLQRAYALFFCGGIDESLRICEDIISASGYGRIVDNELRHAVFGLLADMAEKGRVSKAVVARLLDGRIPFKAFRNSQPLKRIAANGPIRPKSSVAPERLKLLQHSTWSLGTI